MKKTIVISLISILVVMLGASFVFAEPYQQKTVGPMMNYNEMQQIHQKMIDQHVKDGSLTQEQAQVMNEHMSNMSSMMNNMGSMMNGGMMNSTGNGMMGGQGK